MIYTTDLVHWIGIGKAAIIVLIMSPNDGKAAWQSCVATIYNGNVSIKSLQRTTH